MLGRSERHQTLCEFIRWLRPLDPSPSHLPTGSKVAADKQHQGWRQSAVVQEGLGSVCSVMVLWWLCRPDAALTGRPGSYSIILLNIRSRAERRAECSAAARLRGCRKQEEMLAVWCKHRGGVCSFIPQNKLTIKYKTCRKMLLKTQNRALTQKAPSLIHESFFFFFFVSSRWRRLVVREEAATLIPAGRRLLQHREEGHGYVRFSHLFREFTSCSLRTKVNIVLNLFHFDFFFCFQFSFFF